METAAINDIEAETKTCGHSDRGASLVEYALLVALIAMVCVAAVTFFGNQTGDTFSEVSSSVEAT